MAALLTTGNWDASAWLDALRKAAPQRTFVTEGSDAYEPAEITYALTWKPPEGLLQGLPNLEVIFNLGAGVDAIMSSGSIPDVPIVRLVDDDLTERMTEWVTLQVLMHHRGALDYLTYQARSEWRVHDQPASDEVRVGMMGYGVLGRDAARVLLALGFRVHAWSRSPKPSDVTLYVGEDGFEPFLAATDVLVVLLPLTEATREIIDAKLIANLAKDGVLGGPILINGGRGGLQNEADVLAALQSGALRGASLDVFQTEPLPSDDPLWGAPNLVITPHCAAVSDPGSVSRYVTRQMDAYERGEGLTNVVDRERGY